ncbi:hypothetical protein HYW59_04055 [Candidatus Kaiserbacteria bacterium]|nr:hypothetical protein [Candidatus Kaiserbacteria bacterium]
MRIPFTRYSSWAALLGALVLSAGVGYFAWMITVAAEEHALKITSMEQEELEHASALRLHALARETKDARTRLEQLSDSDLVEILDTIESLARDTGIPIGIGQAPSISSTEASPIRVASFIIEAQGTFSQVAQVVALLESLPTPSSLDELQLERQGSVEGGKSAKSWHMVTQMRFFTTADIPAI